MPTPWFDEYIQCIGSGGTLLLGSRAIWCGDWTDLLRVGRSDGANSEVGGADGTRERSRHRTDLAVTLRDVNINGWLDQDNLPVVANAARENALTLMRTVGTFFDDFCDRRKCTLQLTEPSATWEAAAQFEDIGTWRVDTPYEMQVDLLITVSDGLLTEVPGS